jgi:hypothetical protein
MMPDWAEQRVVPAGARRAEAARDQRVNENDAPVDWQADADANRLMNARAEHAQRLQEVRNLVVELNDPFPLPRGGVVGRRILPGIYDSGKRGEELFELILSGIREIYDVTAVIAGGAVRDLVNGASGTSKDVDVFIPIDPNVFIDQSGELGWQGPTQLVKLGPYKKDQSGCVFPTLGRGSSVVQNMSVDLVFTEKPLSPDEVKLFPVHAQRCVYTLEGGKMVSPEAQKDFDNNTFTIDPTIKDKARIEKIVDKIEGWKKRPEYKNWKIITPEVKEWWEDA